MRQLEQARLLSAWERGRINGTALREGAAAALLAELPVDDDDLERIQSWNAAGISVTAFHEEAYPALLREIHNPPVLLFSKGGPISQLNRLFCFAIVGSRRADARGSEFAHGSAHSLVRAGTAVVSGLALGIDGAAHRGALSVGKDSFVTAAVLAGGVDSPTPRAHERLANQIVERGDLLISEYPPGSRPRKHSFLERNRIIAGLSRGVLVVQAPARSGALSTARHALENGRDVYAVPGDPYDPRSEGANNLIRQGATLITSSDQIIEDYAELAHEDPQFTDDPNGSEEGVLRLLQENGGELPRRQITKLLGPESEMVLLELELAGKIRPTPGGKLLLCKA